MGIAAYNRGAAVTIRAIEAAHPQKSHNSQVIDMLNSLPRGTNRGFGDTVVRWLKGRRMWCLMNHEHKGWASFCYEYPSLPALFRSWNLYITGIGCDEHSFFYRVTPGSAR